MRIPVQFIEINLTSGFKVAFDPLGISAVEESIEGWAIVRLYNGLAYYTKESVGSFKKRAGITTVPAPKGEK